MRYTAVITIPEAKSSTRANRDAGKSFLITEMPAAQAEDWAMRAVLAMARSGVEMPDDLAADGIAGLATFGLQGLMKLSFDEAKPLLDEMMDCIVICPDPRNRSVTRALFEDDIEEVGTRLRLRAEVFKLHTGFSAPGANSKDPSQTKSTMAPGSENTPMSPESSAP